MTPASASVASAFLTAVPLASATSASAPLASAALAGATPASAPLAGAILGRSPGTVMTHSGKVPA